MNELRPNIRSHMKPINTVGERQSTVKLQGRNDESSYTDMEMYIAQVWGRLFELESIHVTDDFFDLGGHSLLAIKFEVELEEEGYSVEDLNIEEHRTLEQFALAFAERNQK